MMANRLYTNSLSRNQVNSWRLTQGIGPWGDFHSVPTALFFLHLEGRLVKRRRFAETIYGHSSGRGLENSWCLSI